MQHDGDELDAVALGRGGKAVARGRGIARLQTGRALIEAHELVRVRKAEFPAAHRVHPDGRVVADAVMLQKLPRDHGDVVRRRQVFRGLRRIVQPRAVDKIRVEQAQLLRALVHHADERALAACHMLRQRRGAVVCGAYDDGFEHFVHAHLLARLQIDLAATLGAGGLRGDDGVVPADAAGVQRFHDEQQRHDLRHGRRAQPLRGVLFIEHRARCGIHQDGGGRGDVRPGGTHGRRGGQQHRGRQKGSQPFSHIHQLPSLVSWYKRMRGERRPCGFCAGSRDRIRLHQLSIDFSR